MDKVIVKTLYVSNIFYYAKYQLIISPTIKSLGTVASNPNSVTVPARHFRTLDLMVEHITHNLVYAGTYYLHSFLS